MALSLTRTAVLCLMVLLTNIVSYGMAEERQSIGELISKNAAASSLEIQSEQINRTLLYSLLPVLISFSFFVFIFYRTRRETYFKQKETELKLNISQVEMKALRAQMNPHFIFNCLNSIHHYMHRNDIKQAGEYLIKFSQLIRHVLETSSSRMIPLADDLFALELYIQLEQLRLDHSFEYEIRIDQSINKDVIHIPSMLLQPFIENSIWHGLNRRGQGGKLTIDFCKQEEAIQCIIEDNGVKGFAQKEDYDLSALVKKTSLGMALIHERLEVVNKLYKSKASFTLIDLKDLNGQYVGKQVSLILPYED
jgi:LytS/YehU family sensor histidine kinase